MRILFASLASHGYVYSAARIALELQGRGHEPRVATGIAFAEELAALGLVRVPRTDRDGPSFDVSAWAMPGHVAMQVKHLEHAIAVFRPDVIVGQMLTMGAHIVAEQHEIPLIVLGFATYLWPRAALRHGRARGYARRVW